MINCVNDIRNSVNSAVTTLLPPRDNARNSTKPQLKQQIRKQEQVEIISIQVIEGPSQIPHSQYRRRQDLPQFIALSQYSSTKKGSVYELSESQQKLSNQQDNSKNKYNSDYSKDGTQKNIQDQKSQNSESRSDSNLTDKQFSFKGLGFAYQKKQKNTTQKQQSIISLNMKKKQNKLIQNAQKTYTVHKDGMNNQIKDLPVNEQAQKFDNKQQLFGTQMYLLHRIEKLEREKKIVQLECQNRVNRVEKENFRLKNQILQQKLELSNREKANYLSQLQSLKRQQQEKKQQESISTNPSSISQAYFPLQQNLQLQSEQKSISLIKQVYQEQQQERNNEKDHESAMTIHNLNKRRPRGNDDEDDHEYANCYCFTFFTKKN